MVRDPGTAGRKGWDAVITAAASLAACFIPLRLLDLLDDRPLAYIEAMLTLLFTVDVGLRYRWRHAEGGLWRGARRWLVLDVLAALPFYPLFGPSPLELLRLLKLARVAQFMHAWRLAHLRYWNILRLAFFVYWLGLSVHWLACGWVALRHTAGTMPGAAAYLDGLYWCITTLATVGYGDITPETPAQKVYALFVMGLGVGVFSYIIANIATILVNLDPARAGYLRQMEQLAVFMRYRNIPPALQERIRDYYRYLWEHRTGFDESHLLGTLPPTLSTEVALSLRRDLVQRVPLFQDADPGFIREVALEAQAVLYLPGDFILKAGEHGRDMFFLSQGRAEVLSADGATVYDTLEEGDFFGEIALFLNQPRTASVRALDYCYLYRLDRAMFDRIRAHYPDIAARIERLARTRYRGDAAVWEQRT
jgi:hypothetical protein